jgi:hypothetical protein
MRYPVSSLCLLFVVCARAQSPSVAITGVTVVDVGDGSLHPDQTVVVTGNRISAMGPTDLVAYHHMVHADEILADESRMRLVPQEIRRTWENWRAAEDTREFQSILRPIVPLELENIGLLNKAGVVLLAATDAGIPLQVPGFGRHVELVRLVEAGLTPLETLRTATLNPCTRP